MKKIILGLLAVWLLTSCEKETPNATTPVVDAKLQSSLTGEWNQVGFKNDLFNTWSYTSRGAHFEMTETYISAPYDTKYRILDSNTIYLEKQRQFVDVTLGVDTTLWTFHNGDQVKLIIW